jgi:diguanylate cyclase (GGDEF)-like protein/PAS domain S-box-containing protein
MRQLEDVDRSSSALARRALLMTAILAATGSALGVFGIRQGVVVGMERPLIFSCLLFSLASLVTLLFLRRIPLQTIATVSTIYFAVYLCTGSIIAVIGHGHHVNLFVYLVWFFALLVFNKLVNSLKVGRLLARGLLAAPVLLVCCLLPRLIAIFKLELLLVVEAYCVSYIAFGLMLTVVTRYREAYILERERVESFKVASEVLESISDCFLSLDSEFRLIYLNDAACTEFDVERQAALKNALPDAAPGFFSESMLAGLQAASAKTSSSMFEAHNEERNLWYEMRCFPRLDGMSIYFRNITEAISSRRKLEQANTSLREQAELLDKAQDAIFVQAMDGRILYWNKSAERLYGWTAEEVTGRLVKDIFHDSFADMNQSIASVLQHGEWAGELSQYHRDGTPLIVESRCTLVSSEEGKPASILAINTDITDRKSAEARIQRLAYYDVLTGLPNRLLMRERLDKALATTFRDGSRGAILFIDLDDFKTLNDTSGHGIGDLLLQQVALRLASCIRKTDTVARFGGDEFVVMLEGLSDDATIASAEAKAVGDGILGAFFQPYQVGSYEYAGTTGIGITLFQGRSATADDLLKRADLAMYRAKAQGKNSMCFFNPSMETFAASRAALQSDLRRALQNREFELHYQPQVDSAGSVTGAEALLRWRHPRRGMVPPNEFIPLAEEAGLIVEVGRWVLETACAQLAEWSDRPEMEPLSIAVNVSIRQFLDPHFVDLVLEVLRTSEANPHRLSLEITESSAMEKVDDTIAKMTVLKAYGVSFSLDDFGTGYSSLSHLKRLPLDQLKIDQSFVRDVLMNVTDASIARTIIALGRNLNLSVIAEGVETEGQREFLYKHGCRFYQGYLFSPALPPAQFEDFVAAAPPLDEIDAA